MRMMFKELYLFSPREKLGKKVTFKNGINVITSNQTNGNERGKSVIMRSFYHTLGAESKFADKWDVKNKIFILNFSVDDKEYYIYRAAELFKLFDNNKKLLFVATKSHDLAKKLEEITNFSVLLPNRQTGKYEITPPAYNYLPFFLDQDCYEGSHFKSFKNLEQYANYKEDVLFCHFGVHNEKYFELVKQMIDLKENIEKLEKKANLLLEMKFDIDQKLELGSYSGSIEVLNKDIEQYKNEYSTVVQKLNQSKMKLVKLRNNLYDLNNLLSETKRFGEKTEKEIKKLNQHICPECGSKITETVTIKSKKYNLADDIVIIKNDLQVSINKIIKDIEVEKEKYAELLQKLNEYQEKLEINTTQVNDILRHKGLCELRDSVVTERNVVQDKLILEKERLKKTNTDIKLYNSRKKEIESRYYELLIKGKNQFGLDEINPDKLKKINLNFSASGSNKYIATVIWYFAIIKIRNEFNSNAIQYPIVFDSPNNVEMDDEKRRFFIQYLLSNSELSPQFIISGIGFDGEDFKDMVDKKMNITILENAKYHLLQSDDYLKYAYLMQEMCNAELGNNFPDKVADSQTES